MAGQVTIAGTLLSGPQGQSDASTSPAGSVTIPIATSPDPKTWAVSTGAQVRTLASPSAFVTLAGVGASDSVSRCTLLYVRARAPMSLRLTQVDLGGGADIVSIVQVNGTLVLELPESGYLKLLEAKGSGTIEWLGTGQQ